MIRRQASLYVPLPYRNEIDQVRKEHDPKQHALIPAHVTLCRDSDVRSWEQVEETLRLKSCASITLSFYSPERLEDGCLLLPCRSGREQYRTLRESLLLCGDEKIYDSDPHITLVHPRNAALSTLRPSDVNLDCVAQPITFDTVYLIEQRPNQPWQVTNEFSLE